MARFTIYSKDGRKIRHVGEPQYSGSYMGVDVLEFRSINSPSPIEWQIGDYVDYFRTGKRYKLYSLPMPRKVARAGAYGGSFEYSNVQLFAATKELEIAPFRDIVPDDNKIHFSTRPDVSTYENVYGIARRIQECINDIFPNRWRIEVFDTKDADLLSLLNETKAYSVNNGSCLDALSQIYDTWKNVGWIHTYDSANDIDIITIGRANVRDSANTSDAFAYGKGNGLTSIRKAAANQEEFATRLYVYGSERNIQTRYYNGFDIVDKDSVDIRNLMLPMEVWGTTDGKPDARKAYLQADDSIIEKYGLIPRTVYFDGNENEEIYPSIKGLTMANVRKAMIDAGQGNSEYLPGDSNTRIDQVRQVSITDAGDKESVEKNRTFGMMLNPVGFNIAEQGKLTSEGYATISMKSGMCAGREFKVLKCDRMPIDNSLVLTLERAWDESIGMGFPNKTYPIAEGDEFVLLDIPMPNFYVALAEEKLLEAGEKILLDYTRVSAFYEPSINSIKIKEGAKPLYPGMFMQIYDEDVVETESHTDFVLIDTLTIEEGAELPSYRVTLREQKRSARNYAALEDMIEDAKESTKEGIARERRYTERRFRDVQETIGLLQGAFDNFSEGVNPVTVQTMALMLGDESLQYKFTASRNSLKDIDCPIVYDASLKQMYCSPASLIHMTIGVESIVPADARIATDFIGWNLSEKYSETLENGDARYVYIRASAEDEEDASMVVSKVAIPMNAESGYYHFLVGILNSEYDGKRSFVTLYGYTEILPGQITTDVIRSGSNALVIDLLNARIIAKDGATIEGSIKIEEGSLMSSRLDVGNPQGGDIEAFFNGSDFAKDDSERDCGKLILAAGIPEGDTSELEERARQANTRIYEDGCIYSNNLHLRDGCTAGDLDIRYGSIVAGEPKEYDYTQAVMLSKEGISTQGKTIITGRDEQIRIGDFCGYYSMDIEIGSSQLCYTYDKEVGLHINTPDAYAILTRSGMFAGLRPNCRVLPAGETLLTDFDHTIFAPHPNTRIVLPDSPILGQEYVILAPNGGVIVASGSKVMYLFYDGVERNSFACGDIALRLEARLYYIGTEWYVTTIKH